MEYLVQYGVGAFLGRFHVSATLVQPLVRSDRVVLQTPRGLEIGTVLERSPASASTLGPLGHVVRTATATDEADAYRRQRHAHQLLAEAQTLADEQQLPLMFLDAEILLDGEAAILQAIHYADCDADPLFATLSERHGLRVQLHDLTSTPEPEAAHAHADGCGTCGSKEGGCSSGSCGTGGGCSSGSCSSGKVKSAEEMTAYFAALREQMETTKSRVPLH